MSVVVPSELLTTWGQQEQQARRERQHRPPADAIESFRSLKILSRALPVDEGGVSVDMLCDLVSRIAVDSPSLALGLSMGLGVVIHSRLPEPVLAHQQDAWRTFNEFLREAVQAGKLFGVANAEAATGGDLTKVSARLVQSNDGLKLFGSKAFSTMSSEVDVFLCAARTSDHGPGIERQGRSISGGEVEWVLAEKTGETVCLGAPWCSLGFRSAGAYQVEFVGAPVRSYLGYPGLFESDNFRFVSTLLFASVARGVMARAIRGIATMGRMDVGPLEVERDRLGDELLMLASSFVWPAKPDYLEAVRQLKVRLASAARHAALLLIDCAGAAAFTEGHPNVDVLHDAMGCCLLRPSNLGVTLVGHTG